MCGQLSPWIQLPYGPLCIHAKCCTCTCSCSPLHTGPVNIHWLNFFLFKEPFQFRRYTGMVERKCQCRETKKDVCGCCARRSFFLLSTLWTQPWERLRQDRPITFWLSVLRKGDFLSPSFNLLCTCQVLVWAVNCPGSLFTQNNNSHPQWKYIEAKLRHNYQRWLTWPDTTATKIIPREKSMRNEPWELRLHFCYESSSKRLKRSHRGFKQLKYALLPKQKPF